MRQIAYSLGELERLSGIRKDRIARVLLSNGVKLQRTGEQGKRLVFLSELERRMPEVVDSILFRRGDEE
jgi:hypothetical protein